MNLNPSLRQSSGQATLGTGPLLQNRKVRLGIAGAVLILVLIAALLSLKSCNKKEPTIEELREQHLTYLVQVIESYKTRYGSYPQPTARAEMPEGMKHVWGYEPEKPSLASCTVNLDEGGIANAEKSRCGGGVYDIDGNLIGWKGTFTLESGLNNIEIAKRRSGRVSSPVSEFISVIPFDPLYEKNPLLTAAGFGEYVYAIRNPEAPRGDKREEYQIAATVIDPLTGEQSTTIRGNYFVRVEERERFPASLIGPGLLFDSFGNAVEGQTRPIHVLLDGQKKGFPNPVLGDGENTLRTLSLERRARRFLQSIEERMVVLTSLTGEESTAALAALGNIRTDLQSLLANFDVAEAGSKPAPDLNALEANLMLAAGSLSEIMETFIAARAEKVGIVLTQEMNDREAAVEVLRGVFESLRNMEESVLIARDDVLTYLDGQGIEEQTRSRVGRKLEQIKEELPDLETLFEARNLVPMNPFLTEDQESELKALGDRESGKKEIVVKTGSGEVQEILPALSPKIYAMTLNTEIAVHIADLQKITEDLLDALLNAKAPLEEIDASLKNLAGALESEHERIGKLFGDLATEADATALKNRFIDLRVQNALVAMEEAAVGAKGFGDFAPLLFDSALLDRVILEQSPGIPDTGAYASKLDAPYKGIPYPLP